jgi:hypothetical protein
MKHTTTPFILSLGMTACTVDNVFPGTQIGTEDSLTCTLVLSETLGSLDEIPEGLIRSPRDVIDSLTGTYVGPQMDDNETPTSETVTLAVNDPSSIVTVHFYEGGDADVEYATDPCPPHYTFELQFTMDADGIPSFDGTIEASYRDDSDGNTWAESFDESLFTAALPAPVTFNPTDYTDVEPQLVFSGSEYGWAVYLSWQAYNADEVVEGQDHSVENEQLFWASLEDES